MPKRAKQSLIIFLSSFFLFLITVIPSLAQNDVFTPNVDIPGLNNRTIGQMVGSSFQSTLLANYITSVYDYILAIAGIIASVVLMGGGVLWLVSSGSPDRVKKAKGIITNSLIGLVLLFSSYLILNFINPELTKMKPITVPNIERVETESSKLKNCCSCVLESSLLGVLGPNNYVCVSSEKEFTLDSCRELCQEAKKTLNQTSPTNLFWGVKSLQFKNETGTCVKKNNFSNNSPVRCE